MAEIIECPNCLEHRDGRYCATCGQNDRDYRRSLPPMVGDLLKDAFELDGRLITSMKLLLTKPGALSREFSANRRASYVSPIRLYLFASILFFFVLSLTTDFRAEFQRELAEANAEATTSADEDPDTLRSYLDADRQAKLQQILDGGGVPRAAVMQLSSAIDEGRADGFEPSTVDIIMMNAAIDGLASPQRTLDGMLNNLPFALFFLLPAYALLLKLVYFGKRRYYVEHLVFALHLHTFAFIVFTVMVLLPEPPEDAPGPAGLIGPGLMVGYFVYYFLALRRYYEESRLRTCLKFWLMFFVYSALLGPAMLSVAVVTVTML